MAGQELDAFLPLGNLLVAQRPRFWAAVALEPLFGWPKMKQAALEESGLLRERDALARSQLQIGSLEGRANSVSVKP